MKKGNTIKMIVLSAAVSILFVGCGGGSDSSGGTTPTALTTSTGTFVDAPVQGLSYKTLTQSGFTDAKGEFKYVDGEDVTFKLGNLELGKGKGGALVTPYTVSDNNDTAVNIALLLQNFDDRSTSGVLDLSRLQDANLSDVNLSATNTDMQAKIADLFSDARFNDAKFSFNNGRTVLTATQVKKYMDDYINANSVKFDKKFTQEFLDKTVFYRTSDEYGQYKNQFRNGYMYFAGDKDINDYDMNDTVNWDENFTTASTTFTLENGIILTHHTSNTIINGTSEFKTVSHQITEITDAYIRVLSTITDTNSDRLTKGDTETDRWYLTKEDAKANTISVQYGFGEEWLKGKEFWTVDNSGDTKVMATSTFGTNTLTYGAPLSLTVPYVVMSDGIIDTTEDNDNTGHEYYKIVDIDGSKISLCEGEHLDTVKNCTTAKQWLFTNQADAQAFYNSL